ncbi:hypothetical protein D3C80_1882640 [compost metagenome]
MGRSIAKRIPGAKAGSVRGRQWEGVRLRRYQRGAWPRQQLSEAGDDPGGLRDGDTRFRGAQPGMDAAEDLGL